MTARTKLLVGLYVAAFIGLVAGFAHKYRNDSEYACVSECMAKEVSK